MTFTIKVRGAGAPMLSEYRCPVHGVFELVVERDASGDPPAEASCPTDDLNDGYTSSAEACELVNSGHDPIVCGLASPWTASAPAVHTQFVISASQGRSDPKPHPHAMDTRMIAEGRRNEFRAQRKKIRQELRHKRRKEFLR